MTPLPTPSCHSPTPPAMPKGVRLPLSWMGGKQRYVRHLLRLIPPHACYCEAFAGSAALFFRKQPSAQEVLNDINGRLMNFYRELQKDIRPFWDAHCLAIPSRTEFLSLQHSTGLTGFAAAWRFYYLNRLSFGAKGRTYAVEPGVPRSCRARKFASMPPHLLAAHQRLSGVSLENLSWEDCLARYDRPTTLFYLDPPYMGTEHYYGESFGEKDLERLAEALSSLRGQFILTINDSAREIFAGFNLAGEFGASYRSNLGRPKPGRELIYTGGKSWVEQ